MSAPLTVRDLIAPWRLEETTSESSPSPNCRSPPGAIPAAIEEPLMVPPMVIAPMLPFAVPNVASPLVPIA